MLNVLKAESELQKDVRLAPKGGSILEKQLLANHGKKSLHKLKKRDWR